jgi:hypothetical protein
MAHLLTPTLEQRASREFLKNQPTSTYVWSWFSWLPNWDYTGYWTGYNTNYVENTLGASASSSGSGSGATASRVWSLPAGTYRMHYHIEAKCDTSNANSNNYWTKDIESTGSSAGDIQYYFTGTVNQLSNGTVINSVKQKNVQFCSSRSNTSAIESNRAYVTFDHHLEWSHNGGVLGGISTRAFNGNTQGFVSVEEFWFILKRVR